jgi:single-strand DNA-binding protein
MNESRHLTDPPVADTSADTRPIGNIAVVRGTVRGPVAYRTLPSGAVIAQFDVATEVDGTAARVMVPVAWAHPGSHAAAVDDGVEIVVVGTVRRRFFRVGGVTQSRTELVADAVIPARRRKQVAAALGAVAGRLSS